MALRSTLLWLVLVATGCAAPPHGLSPASDPEAEPIGEPAGPQQSAAASSVPPSRAAPAIVTESPQAQTSLAEEGTSVVETAREYMGVPYRRGGTSKRGLDCSGFTQRVFAQHRVTLPRTCAAQARVGSEIPLDEVLPGDLVFFAEGRGEVFHVGIYAGDGQFIHASSGSGRVRVDALDTGYFAVRLREARRVIP